MANNKTVIVSINADDGWRCVDIFQRLDQSFGFDEFRRDVEDQKAGSQLAIMAVLYLPIRMRPWPQLLTLFLGWPRVWTPHWPPPKQNDP